jgi:hypothetical protein
MGRTSLAGAPQRTQTECGASFTYLTVCSQWTGRLHTRQLAGANVLWPTTILGGVGPGQKWFDTQAFAAPPANTFGNAGRNIVRGPRLSN